MCVASVLRREAPLPRCHPPQSQAHTHTQTHTHRSPVAPVAPMGQWHVLDEAIGPLTEQQNRTTTRNSNITSMWQLKQQRQRQQQWQHQLQLQQRWQWQRLQQRPHQRQLQRQHKQTQQRYQQTQPVNQSGTGGFSVWGCFLIIKSAAHGKPACFQMGSTA